MTANEDSLIVTMEDLQQNILKYGLDIFPPLDVGNEMTRTHDLFRTLREQWPDFYQELNFRPESGKFKVLASFKLKGGKSVTFPTLTLTKRGPVFAFPRRLPDPLGEYAFEGDYDEVFLSSLAILRKEFPGTSVLRMGVVREAVFSTGKSNAVPYLADRFGTFQGTKSMGGGVVLSFRDDLCNVRIKLDTIEIRQEHKVSKSGLVLSDETNYGFQVSLDVNNIEMRPQEMHEIETTIERAHSFWPKGLLEFINWRKV